MKKISVLFIALLLVLNVELSGANAKSKSFQDLSASHWAFKEINFLVDKQVINGYPDGRYGVNDSVTRAEVAVMVMRSYGWEGEWDNPGYKDVSPSHWAYNSIAALYHLDIFKPTGDYKPNQPITRAEMAHILVNAFSLSNIKASNYSDVLPTHTYYSDINKLSGANVTSGYPDGTYRPDNVVTRAEFAVFMSRAIEDKFKILPTDHSEFEGVIYDFQVGSQFYRLNDPLLLTDVWLAPLELFEKIGYVVLEVGEAYVSLHSTKYGNLELKAGETKIWIGDTSVNLNTPLTKVNGQFYVDLHPIVSALETPLVFYPEQFILALEAPTITVSQIMADSPMTALDVIHNKQPYWHWTKKDQDYLELIKINNQINSKEDVLIAEMNQLMNVYESLHQEFNKINGITYISDHVTGKLDAVSRALEARFNLINENKYDYPQIGKSGGFGHIGLSSAYTFDYLVFDHTYQYLDKNRETIIQALTENSSLDFNQFNGLVSHGIPFSITEVSTNNRYAGLASGSDDMLVVNSGLGTFYHELGHNWDAMLGNHSDYLSLRGQAGYTSNNQDWADRVVENFAEDFVVAVMPNAEPDYHRGVFGAPTTEQAKNIKDWIFEKSNNYKKELHQVDINNISVVPTVIYVVDGVLTFNGSTPSEIYLVIKDDRGQIVKSDTIAPETLKEGYSISLTNKGIYSVHIDSIATTIVFN